MRLYYNLFQPVLHLAEKTLVLNAADRPHVQRRDHVAQTPFDRLCATAALPPEQRTKLARSPRHHQPAALAPRSL